MRILVVDSYGSSGQALARLLVLQGHEARWATGAADAARLCRGEKFDLLICDLDLADGSGAFLMRELAASCGMIGISTTVDSSDDAANESHAAGFGAHLLKPLSFDVLCGAIQRIAPSRTAF